MTEELQYSAFQSRYKDKKYIGAGGFGKVYKVFDHAKNHYVALKVSDVRPEWNKFTLKNEVELVNKLNYHRNIARYDACYRFNTGITGEMDFALLKFYEDGNLEQFLKKSTLTQEDKRLIIGGILNGLSFLHENNIIHRDLKAENILMSREDGVWTPKITDFGLSREVHNSTNITNSAVGVSYAYAAPEQILNQKIYRNVDIWAIGVIIYRIIADELPFANRENKDKKSVNTQLEISKKITSNELPQKLDTLEEPFQSIIKRCLVTDPLERAQKPSELIALLKGNRGSANNEVDYTKQGASSIVDSEGEKTVLAPHYREQVNQEQSNIEEALPTPMEYQMPNENQTQFIPKPSPPSDARYDDSAAVEKSDISERKNIHRKTKKTPIIIGVIILLLAGAGVAFWFLIGSSGSEANPTRGEVTFIPTEKPKETAGINSYSELEKEILRLSPDSLPSFKLESQLKTIVNASENENNYRPNYLLALYQTKSGKSPREVLKSLRESARIATSNGAAKPLLSSLKKEENKTFKKISMLRNGEPWSQIIEPLASNK